MTDSPTRRKLEESVRAIIPSQLLSSTALTREGQRGALSSVSGLMTGYAMGWARGRKRRRARKNHKE